MKLNINSKLLISILSVTTAIFIITFGFIGIKMKPIIETNIENLANEHAGKYANLVRSHLTEEMKIARTMAYQYEIMDDFDGATILKQSEKFQNNIYDNNKKYKSVWMSWESRFIDSNYHKNYGRYRVLVENRSAGKEIIYDTLNMNGDEPGLYYDIKTNRKDIITDPYFDDYGGVEEMVASVCCPVIIGGEFAGVAGIDLPLSRFADIIEKAERRNSSKIFLVSNDGVFVGNQNVSLVGTSIKDVFVDADYNIIERIQEGKAFNVNYKMDASGEYYIAFYPFQISGTDTPWMVGVAVPREVINAASRDVIRITIGVGLVGFIIISLVIFFVSRGITQPLTSLTSSLDLLAKGEIYKIKRLEHSTKDEIGDIAASTNSLIDGLSNTALFAKEIGQGNLDADFEVLSDQDTLGNALVDMRASLKKAQSDEENRRLIEEEQNWATSGSATFGELLRNNTDNMEDFTYNVVSNLVKYTGSNQGAIFLVDSEDENDIFLAMSACYAYDRKKFIDKRIGAGEGLVGQCYLEGESIFMTDIPDDYVSITSGLGDANPRSLLIVPLKFNDKVYGVLELASFSVYSNYKIEFIKKIAESIASTISTVRVNLRTVKLLEESKLKSEELAAQEEEMRQNMEELQTTQEESARKEVEMNGILNALNHSYFVGELDLDGNFLTINEKALSILGVTRDTAEGNNIRSFIKENEVEDFNEIWEQVINGNASSRNHYVERALGRILISESYTPVYDDMDQIYKILNIGVEVNPDEI